MIFTDDVKMPEGPFFLPDGSLIVVEMGAGEGRVSQFSPDGKAKRVIAETARPNGLFVDNDGVLWVCETFDPPSLLRMTMDGSYEVFVKECDGQPFLWPNDLVTGPDGALYMTDSGIGLLDLANDDQTDAREDYMDLDYDGRVYRIDMQTKDIRKLDSGFHFSNGIAFSPDMKTLYVGETNTGILYRYAWQEGGTLGPREEFVNVLQPDDSKGIKGPDGFKFGPDGNLYVGIVGQSNVTVVSPEGEILKRIPVGGKMPSNVAFRPGEDDRVYVTEMQNGAIEVHDI
jgi:gluconolactonase